MYFVALTVRMRAKGSSRSIDFTSGVYAHAAVLSAITAADAEAGKMLHDMQTQKHVTIAVVSSDQHSATLRLTFMSVDGLRYATLLMSALATQPEMRFGAAHYVIETVSLDDPKWSGVATWADLTAGLAGRYMHFTFESPTAIAKCDGRGKRLMILYPAPSDLFAGLTRRWRALGGPDLPIDLPEFVQSSGCVISSYNLKTLKFATAERTQIGFVGQVVYECRRTDLTCISALNALARLSFYAGVGYQTARGMGSTRITIRGDVVP